MSGWMDGQMVRQAGRSEDREGQGIGLPLINGTII